MALTWDDIVDVSVDITLSYNPGTGTQQAQSVKAALADWGASWKADMQADYGADYRGGTCDMAGTLGVYVANAIWDTVAALTLTKIVNFQGSVTLTYIKGSTKTKTNSIVPELAHLSNEMIAGNYEPDAIKEPVRNVVRQWVWDAADKCVTDAGG